MATIYAADNGDVQRALQSLSPLMAKAIDQYNEYQKVTGQMWGAGGVNVAVARALEQWRSAGPVVESAVDAIRTGPFSDRLREKTEDLLKVYAGSSQEQAGRLAYYMTLLGEDAPALPFLNPQSLTAAVSFCEQVQEAEPVAQPTATGTEALTAVELPDEFGEELDALIAELLPDYTGDRQIEAQYICAFVTVSAFAAFICLLVIYPAALPLGFLFWEMLDRSRTIGDAAKKRYEQKFSETPEE